MTCSFTTGSVVLPDVLGDDFNGDISAIFEYALDLYILNRLSLFLTISRTKWVKIDGTEYKKGAGIIHSIDEDDLPKIIKISSIYVINGSVVVFKGECFTTQFHPHFRAYVLQSLNCNKLVQHCKLLVHVPLHIRACTALNLYNVIMPYNISG